MSETSLLGICGMLPESCQEQAILNCLNMRLANGEWSEVDSILISVGQIRGHTRFKANALAIGVKCAVRSKNLALALERFDSLSNLGMGADIVTCKADALLQLASPLLSDKPGQLARLWTQLLSYPLPIDAQDTCRLIGLMLVRQCRKNQDSVTANQIQELVCRHLPVRGEGH